MAYFNNILCIPANDIIRYDEKRNVGSEKGFLPYNTYDSNRKRGNIRVLCPGKGQGNTALIEFESMRKDIQEKYIEIYGDPRKKDTKVSNFRNMITIDAKARRYYTEFRFSDGGVLPPETIQEYTINASILNALCMLKDDTKLARKQCMIVTPKTKIWDILVYSCNEVRSEFKHTLPTTEFRLRKKVSDYIKGGYEALISGRFRNSNTRKVSMKIEKVIVALYCMDNKPYTNTVSELYMMFLLGKITVADVKTGEIYQPSDCYDKDGQPIMLSESTIWNYLNNPKNRIFIDKSRSGGMEFDAKHRPHHLRHSPNYAFSKISLDDRDLPRKLHDGTRVKAYYAYDVASQCVIGYAYNRDKNRDLFIDCVRNMFRLIYKNGFCLPAEVEVEHHLVNTFADGLMKAGEVFPIVRWCNPGNSKEKRAEHFNRLKKYTVEKNKHTGIGRWYLKLEANRTIVNKVFDEKNNTYKEPTYDYDTLVADDIADIQEYNNALHSDQKKYPGMTRWEVLCEMQNLDLEPIDKMVVARYIGECTSTSIRHNQYVTVQFSKYALPAPEVMRLLSPNNYKVNAYYIPDENGLIKEVYLFQDNDFICCCQQIVRYNEATAEQTDIDKNSYTEQAKYVSHFDKMVKDNRVPKVTVIKNETMEAIEEVIPKLVEEIPVTNLEDNYEECTIYDFDYDPEAIKAAARRNI